MKRKPGLVEIYYYIRDKEHKPMISVCLLVNLKRKEVLARGVAICSKKETPCKKKNSQQRNGPRIAKRRALQAISTKEDGERIVRDEPLIVISETILEENSFSSIFKFKSFWKPEISAREETIINSLKL